MTLFITKFSALIAMELVSSLIAKVKIEGVNDTPSKSKFIYCYLDLRWLARLSLWALWAELLGLDWLAVLFTLDL